MPRASTTIFLTTTKPGRPATTVRIILLTIMTTRVLRIQQQRRPDPSLVGVDFPALAVSAAFMLFTHKHGEDPSADKIYRHHVLMGITGIIAMIAKVLDDTQLVKRKVNSYLWAGLMMGIGLMLFIYTE